MGILEKIKDIEQEISRTQKNKATEHHLGILKAKLAKYRTQLLEPTKTKSGSGEGFEVTKFGDARVNNKLNLIYIFMIIGSNDWFSFCW